MFTKWTQILIMMTMLTNWVGKFWVGDWCLLSALWCSNTQLSSHTLYKFHHACPHSHQLSNAVIYRLAHASYGFHHAQLSALWCSDMEMSISHTDYRFHHSCPPSYQLSDAVICKSAHHIPAVDSTIHAHPACQLSNAVIHKWAHHILSIDSTIHAHPAVSSLMQWYTNEHITYPL